MIPLALFHAHPTWAHMRPSAIYNATPEMGKDWPGCGCGYPGRYLHPHPDKYHTPWPGSRSTAWVYPDDGGGGGNRALSSSSLFQWHRECHHAINNDDDTDAAPHIINIPHRHHL